MNNPIEGRITIKVDRHRPDFERVFISSSRPLQACEIFIGKTPEQVLAIIPMMYNICGHAQSRASLAAFQSCLNVTEDPKAEIARELLLLTEIAKEHLMRIFLDWPRLFNSLLKNKNLPFINQLSKQFQSTLFVQGKAFSLNSQLEIDQTTLNIQIDMLEQYLAQHVYGCSTQEWLNIHDVEVLNHWANTTTTIPANTIKSVFDNNWQTIGKADSTHLAKMNEDLLIEHLDSSDSSQFIASPTWLGDCCETSSFSRQYHHPLIQNVFSNYNNSLLTRITSRLVELASIPQQLTELSNKLTQQHPTMTRTVKPKGLSTVETARGRLVHRIKLEDGIISHYKILAPTEWNFHPKGVVNAMLANLQVTDPSEFETLAHILINAIDPCVGYELNIV